MIEVAGNVIGILRPAEIRLVTLVAILIHQAIVVIGMTRLALQPRVTPCQRKTCCRMIERRRAPGCRCMTLRAVRAEIPRLVIRIGCRIIIATVTIDAIGGCIRVLVVDVTLIAGDSLMCSCQGKACHRVIEGCRTPSTLGMTCLAVRRKIACDMIGIRGPVKIRAVACNAIRRLS